MKILLIKFGNEPLSLIWPTILAEMIGMLTETTAKLRAGTAITQSDIFNIKCIATLVEHMFLFSQGPFLTYPLIFVSNESGYLDKFADAILAPNPREHPSQDAPIGDGHSPRRPIDFFTGLNLEGLAKNITLLRGRCSEIYRDWSQLDEPEIEAMAIRNLMEPISIN